MTKLTYKIVSVNNEVIATDIPTYAEAVKVKSENKGSRMVSCYSPIIEKSNIFLTPKKITMRVKATV